MRTLHDGVTRTSVAWRIESLRPESARLWGRMTIDQMLWHVNQGLLAGLGVFFRDLGNAVGPLVQLLFFLTPIVYPPSVLDNYPAAGHALRLLNPFVIIVESARLVLIEGQWPDWGGLSCVTAIAAVVAMASLVSATAFRSNSAVQRRPLTPSSFWNAAWKLSPPPARNWA